MKKWKRNEYVDRTGVPFIPPSPNIRNLKAALLYPGIGCFEATNVSVGRGTKTPFEIFGAPWISGKLLSAHLRMQNIPGVLFEPHVFKPKKDLYKGKRCKGVRLIITDRQTIRPLDIFLISFHYLLETYPEHFKPKWEEIRVVTGNRELRNAIRKNTPIAELIKSYQNSATQFEKDVAPYLLYD